MNYQCIYVNKCKKKWSEKPSRNDIIIHNRDDHGSLLMLLEDNDLMKFVNEVD